MSWPLSRIRAKVRELTGKPATSQISDADILLRINDYYLNVLPSEVSCQPLHDWYQFNTADGTGTQALPSNVIAISSPVYLDGDPITLWTDDILFFEQYPFSNTDESEPTDILLDGRTLYIRPIPDATYAVRIRADIQPGAEFVDDTDTPTDDQWGPLISYGTAIEILQDDGDTAQAIELAQLYKFHKANVETKNIRQTPTQKRANPRF